MWKIWTHNKWSKINRVIRHKTYKKMFRVLTHTGCVDVTEDHSLLDENKNIIKPGDCDIGQKLLHSFPEITENLDSEFDVDEARIFGFFVGDGSCGFYSCNSGDKYSWALNNSDKELLIEYRELLTKIYGQEFKILDTLESSGVYKLVPKGKIKHMVSKYRELFYNEDKYKIIPQSILNSSKEVKDSFLEGFWDADGCRSDFEKVNCHRFDQKGKINCQSFYILLSSLGYNVSINCRDDKLDIYRLTYSKNPFRKSFNTIKKILPLEDVSENTFVYDIETVEGNFQAGIGQMIVKNTDSNYIHFPNKDTAPELWDFCFKVEKEMLDIFPPPMKMAFEEKIYWRFFIITKKRYMALSCERDGVLDEDVYKKGVLLARRDNSKFIRDTYAKVIMPIFERTPKDDVLYIICNELNRMCSSSVNFEDFVITKSVGDISGYKIRELPTDEKKREKRIKDLGINPELQSIPASDSKYRNRFEEMYILRNLPAQVQLAERMKRRGKVVQSGSRIPYVITTMGGVDAKQFVKIEDPSYQQEHSDIIKIDYLYYLHLLINPIDQLLEVAYKMEKFMKSQHKLRVQKYKMCRQIDELFNSTLDFVSESS